MPRQQQSGHVSEAHKKALIPSSRMEFPVQRRWACSIFVFLQAWKLADLFVIFAATYPEQYNNYLLKWWLIDTLYLVILHVAKIPWLQFTVLKTTALILFMMFFNFIVFALPIIGFTGIVVKNILGDAFGRLISVSQARPVNVKDIVYNSSHILGRHTVQILPYGTAKLNPNDEVYCLQSNEIGKKDIYIPIILNNTIPRTVSISRHDFETGVTTVKDYSGRDIIRATEINHAKEGVEYYYIRVQKTGVYKLDKIISKDNVDVRLYNRNAFIFTCPNAHFKPIQASDYCTGDSGSLQLEITGVPPLHVQYKRKSDDKETILKLDRIQPETFDSPLLRRPNGPKVIDPSFFIAKPGSDYSWAAVQKLNVNLNLTLETASKQEYSLTHVVDGAGNEIDLTPLHAESFQVHARPKVKFLCKQTDPVSLLIGSKSTQLPVQLKGTGPFQVEYTFSGEPDHVHKTKLNGANSITVSSPGEYDLVSVSDKFCQGQVMFPSTCQVVQPQLPSIKIQSTPIPSECAGDNEIGMKFIAEFVGAPPYVLEYTVTKQKGRSKTVVERKREVVDRSRHIFSYLPSSSGEYIYEFNKLDDRHYKNRATHIAPIKQVVHPQPDAKFSPKTQRSVRTCLGEDLSVDVDLRGTGPFVLTWTVNEQLYSDSVDGDKYTINLPPFDRAGHHIVSLVHIQDANGCIKDLEARDFTVDVRSDRPTAFFHTQHQKVRTVEITEGATANLPIGLTGEGPWTVTYRNVEAGDRSKVTQRFTDPNAEVKVKQVGHYELLSVEDSICKGDVLEPQYLIKWIDKPTIAIPEDQQVVSIHDGAYERAAVCQGTSDAIDIEFNGRGPFYCSYKEFRGPVNSHYGFHLIGQEEVSTGLQRVRLPLKTRESGKYRYVFEKLSDQRYTEPFSIDKLQIEQVVHATPTVKFSSRSVRKQRTLCVGESLMSSEMDPIYLDFTGVAPFSVELGVRLQSQANGRVIKLENIITNKYKLELPDELTAAGTYYIKLLNVNDANGCGSHVPEQGDDTMLTVKVLDIPLINSIESCDDVCVGDTIDYSLFGMGPFTVQYLFNGRSETAKSQTSKLTMIADKPGNITIVSVGDQRNKCRSFPKDMTKQIHEVPSSFISGGKEIIESIHEGDMVQAVVDLVGTPPFDFEWHRYKLVWDQNKKRHYKGEVLESHNVYGVEEHRYYINTSVEGIIEIVSIKDKYCQYPI